MSVLHQGARGTPGVAGLGPWLARIAPRRARGQVTVAIVSDAAVRRLNRRFRGIDEATDVLSFPSDAEEQGRGQSKGQSRELRAESRVRGARAQGPKPRARSEEPTLGDIVIARGVATRQARSLGHPYRTELRILALHGLLHLLGYDHDVDNGRMARVEARLRRRGKLPAGLIARAS